MKLLHELRFLEQHSTLNQILEVRVDPSTDARLLCRPFTSGYVDMVANLVAHHQHTSSSS